MVAIDMKKTEFKAEHEALAAAWKKRSTDPARRSPRAGALDQPGRPAARPLPPLPAGGIRRANLLPHVSRGAIDLFRELGIPWHAGIDDGPGNNLLSIAGPVRQRADADGQRPAAHQVSLRAPASTSPRCWRSSPAATSRSSTSAPPTTSTRAPGRRADPRIEVHQRRRRVPLPHLDRARPSSRWSSGSTPRRTWRPSSHRPGYDKTRAARYGATSKPPTGRSGPNLIDLEWMLRRAVLPADAAAASRVAPRTRPCRGRRRRPGAPRPGSATTPATNSRSCAPRPRLWATASMSVVDAAPLARPLRARRPGCVPRPASPALSTSTATRSDWRAYRSAPRSRTAASRRACCGRRRCSLGEIDPTTCRRPSVAGHGVQRECHALGRRVQERLPGSPKL